MRPCGRCVQKKMLSKIIHISLLLSGALGVCDIEPLHLEIHAPGSMEALEGSCLQIPCTFAPLPNPDITFNTPVTGIWIKTDHNFGSHPENVIFNSSLPVNTYPMEIIGNLQNKNCTTLFYNLSINYKDKYYFRMESKDNKATAVCDPIQVIIKDSPWSPSVQISGELTETELLTITCSAVTPCPLSPPQLTWDLQQGTPNIIETNSDGTFVTKITQNITLTHSHDGLQIRCSAAYPATGGVKTTTDKITLNVTYAPKNTSVRVSPSGPLSAGQLVNLSCSSQAKPPVDRFTWFRVRSQGADLIHEGDTYSFSFNQGSQEEYYCEATNKVGKQTSATVHLSNEESAGGLANATVAVGVVVIIIILAVGLAFWRLRKQKPSQQSLTADALPRNTRNGDEHYSEIDFSKLRPKPVGQSVQDKDQDTVYAQVRVSNEAQSTDNYDIYAQVNKNKR